MQCHVFLPRNCSVFFSSRSSATWSVLRAWDTRPSYCIVPLVRVWGESGVDMTDAKRAYVAGLMCMIGKLSFEVDGTCFDLFRKTWMYNLYEIGKKTEQWPWQYSLYVHDWLIRYIIGGIWCNANMFSSSPMCFHWMEKLHAVKRKGTGQHFPVLRRASTFVVT